MGLLFLNRKLAFFAKFPLFSYHFSISDTYWGTKAKYHQDYLFYLFQHAYCFNEKYLKDKFQFLEYSLILNIQQEH